MTGSPATEPGFFVGIIPGLFPGLLVPESPGMSLFVPVPFDRENKNTKPTRSKKCPFCKGFCVLALATPGRFELPTFSLEGCCSIHLSYGAVAQR
jgi:hypothetical protein